MIYDIYDLNFKLFNIENKFNNNFESIYLIDSIPDIINESFLLELESTINIFHISTEDVFTSIENIFRAIVDLINKIINWIRDKIMYIWKKIKEFFNGDKSSDSDSSISNYKKTNNINHHTIESLNKDFLAQMKRLEKQFSEFFNKREYIEELNKAIKEISMPYESKNGKDKTTSDESFKLDLINPYLLYLHIVNEDNNSRISLERIPILEPDNINKLIKELLGNMISEDEINNVLKTYSNSISYLQKINIDNIQDTIKKLDDDSKHETNKWIQFISEARKELLKIDINKINDISVLQYYINKYNEMIRNINESLSKLGENISDKEKRALMIAKTIYQKIINICNDDIKIRTSIAKSYMIISNKLKTL